MNGTRRNYLMVALKGYAMGAANVVPGVSGGTIALLTGIYSKVVESIAAATDKKTWQNLLGGHLKEFWGCINGSFLVALLAGVLLSVFSLAKLLTVALSLYPVLVWAFFFGLIIASALVMFKDIKGWKAVDVLFLLGGAALGVAVCLLSPTNTPDSLFFIFICGAVSICTMILPGISGSFVLLLMGKYDYIMDAIAEFNIPVLLVFALGCLVGILAFAKFLHWLLAKAERQTLIVLLGFVLGSLVKVWPWSNMEAIAEAQVLRGLELSPVDMQIPGAVVCAIVGFVFVLMIEKLGKKRSR